MVWIILAIILAGYLIARYIEKRSKIQAQIQIEAYDAYSRQQLELERLKRNELKNTPEYRKKHSIISSYLYMLEMVYQGKKAAGEILLAVERGNVPTGEKQKRLAAAAKIDKEATQRANAFWQKFNENDPYNPGKIPFDEWPDDLLKRHEWLENERRNLVLINMKTEHLKEISKMRSEGIDNETIEQVIMRHQEEEDHYQKYGENV